MGCSSGDGCGGSGDESVRSRTKVEKSGQIRVYKEAWMTEPMNGSKKGQVEADERRACVINAMVWTSEGQNRDKEQKHQQTDG